MVRLSVLDYIIIKPFIASPLLAWSKIGDVLNLYHINVAQKLVLLRFENFPFKIHIFHINRKSVVKINIKLNAEYVATKATQHKIINVMPARSDPHKPQRSNLVNAKEINKRKKKIMKELRNELNRMK